MLCELNKRSVCFLKGFLFVKTRAVKEPEISSCNWPSNGLCYSSLKKPSDERRIDLLFEWHAIHTLKGDHFDLVDVVGHLHMHQMR